MYEVNVRWIGNHQYVAEGHEGRHAILLDIPEKSGGTDMGLHATELLLIAVGKCSAVDVVNILKKQRVDLKSLRVVVSEFICRMRSTARCLFRFPRSVMLQHLLRLSDESPVV